MNRSDSGSASDGLSPEALTELWQDVLARKGSNQAQVVSSSMFPVIRKGDRVRIQKAVWQDISFGDIIVFKRGGRLAVHRALGKGWRNGRRYLLEKGDAVLWRAAVPEDDLIGRVCTIESGSDTLNASAGWGRALQVALGLESYAALQLWRLLALALRLLRQDPNRRRYGGIYRWAATSLHWLTVKAMGPAGRRIAPLESRSESN